MLGRIVPGELRLGLLCGELRVVQRLGRVAGGEHRRFDEVLRQAAGALVGARAPAPLQRLGDLPVNPDAAGGGELVEQRLLHQRMREAVVARLRHLLDDARFEPFLDQPQQLVLVAFAQQRERVVGELAPDDGGHLEELVRLFRDAVEPAAQRLAHAVGHGDVGDGVGR